MILSIFRFIAGTIGVIIIATAVVTLFVWFPFLLIFPVIGVGCLLFDWAWRS